MKDFPRHIIAGALIALYAVIMVMPLAPLAVSSAYTADAFGGECSCAGVNCRCPLERKATTTCTCSDKNLLDNSDKKQKGYKRQAAECCTKNAKGKTVSISCNCCGNQDSHDALCGPMDDALLLRIIGPAPAPDVIKSLHAAPGRLTDHGVKPPLPPPKPSAYS